MKRNSRFYIEEDITFEKQGFAFKTLSGYELYSNTRDILYRVKKQTLFSVAQDDTIDSYNVTIFIKEDSEWVEGSDRQTIYSINELIERLSVAPEFTNAVADYRSQNN